MLYVNRFFLFPLCEDLYLAILEGVPSAKLCSVIVKGKGVTLSFLHWHLLHNIKHD